MPGTCRGDRAHGDQERFRALFAAARPALCRYGFLRGFTRADSEDLVAEVLEIACRQSEVVPVEGLGVLGSRSSNARRLEIDALP